MKRFIITVISLCFLQSAFTQDKPLKIAKIDGKPYYSDEFLYLYEKNNQSENKESIDTYLQRFIDYKLKVNEAVSQGLDTVTAFKKELKNYENQLTGAYKFRKRILDSLVVISHKHMEQEVEVKHLFIKSPANSPTRQAEKAKADSLLKAIKGGADFEKLVLAHSQDRNVERTKGSLGYITGMKLPFDLEQQIYATKLNETGEVFQSPAGFHIIKVTDIRPARGKVKIAHIYRRFPADSTHEQEVKDSLTLILKELKGGLSFGEAAKLYSDDQNTKTRKGELPEFSTGEMVPEIESGAYALQTVGEIAGPIQTQYGWHFIQLLEKTPISSFEVSKYSLRTKIEISARMGEGMVYFFEKLKTKYNFKELAPISDFYAVVNDSIFAGTWDAKKASKLTKPFFSFDGVTFNQKEFTKTLVQTNTKRKPEDLKLFIDKLYSQLIYSKLEEHADKNILKENKPLTNLLKEYHDGILLFELLENEVWKKAQNDSIGLADFFEANRDNYTWENRIEATVIECSNPKTLELARELYKKQPDCEIDVLLKAVKASGDSVQVSPPKLFEEADGAFVGSLINGWVNGENKKIETDTEKLRIYYIHRLAKPARKELNEAKGIVVADYQDVLEKEWISSLRNKSKIKIYKRKIKKLKALKTSK